MRKILTVQYPVGIYKVVNSEDRPECKFTKIMSN